MPNIKTKILNGFRLILFRNRLAEKLIRRLTTNKPISSALTRIPANYYQYSKGSIRKVRNNGISYELDLSDYMEWLVYFGIKTEAHDQLFSLISDKDIIFDVGANIGYTTLNFAKITDKKGSVHCFEPSKECVSKLKKNVTLNKFSNIVINDFGLGEREGEYYLSAEVENNKGGNRISSLTSHTPNIHVATLDHYVNRKNINRIYLIKIDVEGYELNVLRGGIKSIETFKPVLFIELDDENLKQQNSSAKELIAFLKNYYNSITDAFSGEDIRVENNFSNCHTDIIARVD